MSDFYHHYECLNPDCPCSAVNGGSGVVLDLRLGQGHLPTVRPNCPLCNDTMDYRGKTEADEDGYDRLGKTISDIIEDVAEAKTTLIRAQQELHRRLMLKANEGDDLPLRCYEAGAIGTGD